MKVQRKVREVREKQGKKLGKTEIGKLGKIRKKSQGKKLWKGRKKIGQEKTGGRETKLWLERLVKGRKKEE